MGIGDAQGGQRFPVSADEAWKHLLRVAPDVGTVKESDDFLKRVVISTGMSAFSWGETVAVSVEADGDSACRVVVGSGLKVGMNWAGSSRNTKNINAIISALSASLRAAR